MTPHEPMDWLKPAQENISGARITRYSLFVSSMKVALPALAAAILLVVMMWSSGNNPPAKSAKIDALDSTMRDAVFTSRDAENRPFTVEAPLARQNPDTPDMIDLTRPTGTITLDGQGPLTGAAKEAQYDQKNGTLNVRGAVQLRNSEGATLETEDVHIDVNARTATGDKPVVLKGAFGEVRGSGIAVKDGVTTFTGPSSATLNMGSGPASSKAQTPTKILP